MGLGFGMGWGFRGKGWVGDERDRWCARVVRHKHTYDPPSADYLIDTRPGHIKSTNPHAPQLVRDGADDAPQLGPPVVALPRLRWSSSACWGHDAYCSVCAARGRRLDRSGQTAGPCDGMGRGAERAVSATIIAQRRPIYIINQIPTSHHTRPSRRLGGLLVGFARSRQEKPMASVSDAAHASTC